MNIYVNSTRVQCAKKKQYRDQKISNISQAVGSRSFGRNEIAEKVKIKAPIIYIVTFKINITDLT